MHEVGPADPLFSLVIATFGRGATLRACLKSLEQETVRDFEVLVVDQNDDDRVEEVLADFRGHLPIAHYRQSLKNASLARNAGAALACGEWIGFPDDDCKFETSTLAAIRSRVARSDVDLLTGMVRDESGTPVLLDWYPTECRITNLTLRRTAAESSLYVRRELFLEAGGFDPVFGPGGVFYAEECVDFIRRLWANPNLVARMVYSPSICFVHHDCSWYADEEAVRRARLYSLGRGASFARHWKQASIKRLVKETMKHVVGSIFLRGLRRRSRIESLVGNLEGFIKYHQWQQSMQSLAGTGTTSQGTVPRCR